MDCCMKSDDKSLEILVAQLSEEVSKLRQTTTAKLLIQDGKIAETCVYIKNNLSNYLVEMFSTMEYTEEINEIITKTLLTELGLYEHLKVIITPQLYGAKGDGFCDDTENLQKAIDEANKKGRVLFIPHGTYKISKPPVLNGCTLIGEPGNIYNTDGVVIECETNTFTAIRQGSTSTMDIMFNLKNIIVKNAGVGFELIYVVNSTFERLYAVDCGVGFKLGAPESVGSMFCEFNNLYTSNCVVGIEVNSAQYFNNNRFNNGFIDGIEKAMSIIVTGGYGAVDNTFNNVEFRSRSGRGIELTRALNTIFNNCYFECGGNILRTKAYSTVTMDNCVYGLFTPDNKYVDVNMIYSEGGSAFTFNGGTIFLTDTYTDKTFFDSGNVDTFQNVVVVKPILRNGTATGFTFFNQRVKTTAYEKEEHVLTTGTVTVPANSTIDVPFTYPTPFSSIPNVVLYTMRGNSGNNLFHIISERTKEGGVLKVNNSGGYDISVSFSIYAKIL